jgi:hypothetical protein
MSLIAPGVSEPEYTRYLVPAVGEMIAAENARYTDVTGRGGVVETSWVGQWDAEREVVTSARLVARGSNAEVMFFEGDIMAGEVDIHSHTVHSKPYPSEADNRVAVVLARIGAGMLIVTHDCREGYLVRPPIPPTISRNGPGRRCWNVLLGRWSWWFGYRRRLYP